MFKRNLLNRMKEIESHDSFNGLLNEFKDLARSWETTVSKHEKITMLFIIDLSEYGKNP